ncbi:DUF262 domain-containing protein [Micromonospora chersina]|uniref:DUF262 domain-containing protein n=1 Tax=Micromonospora chersina TaxID=47854 RepID=UPI00367C2954
MAGTAKLFAPEDEAITENSEDEPVGLVSDQGEDESDAADDTYRFEASIAAKDWTVETLVSQMRKGRIDLSPSFQRRNAWLDNRKSKLIESILLGFPIPQIVLAEKPEKPGHFFVLDGKQRLLALRQFFVDEDSHLDEGFEKLTLKSLEVLGDLNGFDASDLEDQRPELLAALENNTIRTVVLGQWKSERLLLSLFLRLNTGSVPLSPQELRQALIPGGFIQWLDEVSGSMIPMRRLLGNSHPDRRMVDAELALRHLAFSMSPVPYRGSLKQFLDDTSRALNDRWEEFQPQATGEVEELAEALDFLLTTFGPAQACRKWSRWRYERALNRAVYDIQAYSFSFSDIREAAEGRGEEILREFNKACDENTAFIRAITSTTKTREAFAVRHKVWAAVIKKTCGIQYPLPQPLDAY